MSEIENEQPEYQVLVQLAIVGEILIVLKDLCRRDTGQETCEDYFFEGSKSGE